MVPMTSPLSPYVVPPTTALALVASVAAVPALGLLFTWIAARVAGAAPAPAERPEGGITLGVGVAGAFLSMALVGTGPGLFLAVPLGFFSLILIGVASALLARPASRAAVRRAFAHAPGVVPAPASATFGLALAVCGWSLASTLRWVLAALTHRPSGAGGGGWDTGLVPFFTLEALPSLVIWVVGRSTMVAGALALLRARYAGTLVYSAGFVVVLAHDLARGATHARSLPGLAQLAVEVAALVLAWRYVRPRPSLAAPIEPA